jgi:hypothetical protein
LFSRWSRRADALTYLLLLVAVACGPSQGFRPAGFPSDGRDTEIGLAVSSIEPRPYVNEATQRVGQAWWSVKLDERWSLSTIVGFDTSSLLGGAALRYELVDSSWFALAGEAEAGLFWAGISVPVSLRVWRLALYSTPRLSNWGPNVTPFIPVGLSVKIADALIVRGEAQLTWADFQYYNRRVHWGVAIAHEW